MIHLVAFLRNVAKPNIQFEFDVEKAVQAAGELLRLEGKPMGRLRLLKLLYAANRRSIKQTGFPLIRARAVAMDKGPLHSEILDAINGQHPRWSEFFRNDGDDVVLVRQTPDQRLSEFDVNVLKTEYESLAPYDDQAIIAFFHNLPEYKSNFVAGTSTTIPLEDIIDSVGREADKADILGNLTSLMTISPRESAE